MWLYRFFCTTVLLVGEFGSRAAAVKVEGIELEGGGTYAQLQARAALHCRYSLDEGQQLEKLGWFRDAVPVLTWTPPEPPLPSAEFRDRVDVDASANGSLVLGKTAAEDAGPYTCTVRATDAKQDSSDQPYHLVVADVPKFGFSMTGNVADCVLHFSFSGPPIYPKPTPLCGVWSTDTSYTNTASDWQAVPYHNGSVAYAIHDTTFQVRGMPLQAGVRCEMSFVPPSGVADDDRIVAWTNTAYYPQVSERGCPPLEVGDGMVVHYNNHRTTCRGELAPQDSTMQLIASIACQPGHKSSLRGGGMSSLQLQCVGGQQWDPVGGISWDEFEDMECTEDFDAPVGETVHARGESEGLQDSPEPEAEPDSGSSTVIASSVSVALAIIAGRFL
ncbi:uncharacterized protein LOC108669519 [Hyalella azteca]|uniref:Uncharacterized protein LOC108669519 n=1 Tax=Hyalella azteca TaxID=294128 RepID=A0A8B7NFG2_HYAAZ|nr:uncharacterized protein LOC108669519 [Hyalella azteca]